MAQDVQDKSGHEDVEETEKLNPGVGQDHLECKIVQFQTSKTAAETPQDTADEDSQKDPIIAGMKF